MAAAKDLFFGQTGLDRGRVQGIVDDALKGADDGEMYLEHVTSEGLAFDNGRLKSASRRNAALIPKEPKSPVRAQFVDLERKSTYGS